MKQALVDRSADGSAAVGESQQGAVPTAVRDNAAGADTILRDFVATGSSEIALPVEVGPPRGQPDQPGRAGERGPYLSDESGGYSAATTGSDGNSAEAAKGGTFAGGCLKCGKKGHRVTNCMVKLCS